MRERELKLVIVFHITAEAIAMEMVCRRMEIPGRLIPVLWQISADCGLFWSVLEGWRKRTLELMGVQELGYWTIGIYLT